MLTPAREPDRSEDVGAHQPVAQPFDDLPEGVHRVGQRDIHLQLRHPRLGIHQDRHDGAQPGQVPGQAPGVVASLESLHLQADVGRVPLPRPGWDIALLGRPRMS